MNSIFGDATTIAPTPETLAEAESIFSDGGGARSPVPSFRLNGGDREAQQDANIPDMDLQPPDVEIQDGKPMLSKDAEGGEGVGGWISSVVKRAKGEGNGASSQGGSGRYRRVGQEDER